MFLLHNHTDILFDELRLLHIENSNFEYMGSNQHLYFLTFPKRLKCSVGGVNPCLVPWTSLLEAQCITFWMLNEGLINEVTELSDSSYIWNCPFLPKDFPGGWDGKNLPTMQESSVQPLDWDEALEKEMATHSSILVWKIPWTEEPGGLQSMGSQRVGHNWVTNTFTSLPKDYPRCITVAPIARKSVPPMYSALCSHDFKIRVGILK